MASPSLRIPVVLLLLAALPWGCAATVVAPDSLPADVLQARVDPHHVVFICPGMLKDFGSPWARRLQKELRDDGILGLRVTYWTGPLGVWFNWGSIAPARHMVDLAGELSRLHAASASERPLVIDAVGYSHGCETILRAASELDGVRFRRVVLVHSSSFAFSSLPGRLIAEGQIGEIHHFWSPLDIVTLLAPLGAGQFSMRASSDRIRNEMSFWPHLPLRVGATLRHWIRDWLAQDHTPATAPDAFDRSVPSLLVSPASGEH